MGTYTTYFGRIRLDKSLPANYQKALAAMVQGKDTIDGEPFLLQCPKAHSAFANGGFGVAGFQRLADFRATEEGFTLTFCATSKSVGDEYHWLIKWLAPWFTHDFGDMVMASVDENYETDIVEDKVAMTAYRWTPWHWGQSTKSQVDKETPWSVNPWFRPFLTGVIEQ